MALEIHLAEQKALEIAVRAAGDRRNDASWAIFVALPWKSTASFASSVAIASELPQLTAYFLRPASAPLCFKLFEGYALGPLFGVGVSRFNAVTWGSMAKTWIVLVVFSMAATARAPPL